MSALQEIAVDLAAEHATEAKTVRSGSLLRRLDGWFLGLPVGQKIRVFFGFNLGFALLAGIFVIVGYLQLGERSKSIELAHEKVIAAERLLFDISEAQRHAEMFFTVGDQARGQAALDRLARAEAKIQPLRDMLVATNPEASEKLHVVADGIAEYRQQVSSFDPDRRSSASVESRAAAVTAIGGTVLDAGLEIAALLGQAESEAAKSGLALIWTLLSVWIGLTATLTLLTLVAERYLSRNVTGSLAELTAQMSKLASGDKDVAFPGKDRSDEVGQMARALEVFHRAGVRLERLSLERSERAKIELEEQACKQRELEEARVERDRALHNVADQFERTIGEIVSGVAAASSQLQATSETMADTAQKTSARTGEVAQSMTEANRGATAAAAASDEFAMSISEISRQAASSAELARKATTSATEADATISDLSSSADQVGQIVELIQTIAQRTNLLALNASIEAARGGEAGRGFAVVASEVKELAMQTSRATEQIAEQIRGMQDTTSASVGALRTIAEQVQELETTAVSIASAVDQQSVAGQDLARSIDLAARGTEQVSDHISGVRDLSLSTGSAASQVLDSATDLEQQASTLRSQVDLFLAKVRTG